MGDDSSPTADTDEQTDQIEVDASGYHDETDPVAGGGLGFTNRALLEILGLSFLVAVAMEFGKRVGRDLARHW